MDINMVFLFVFGLAGLFLVILNIFLLFYFFKTSKKIDALSEKGKIKNLKNIFLKQVERDEKQDEKIKEILSKLEKLENVSEKTIQKAGIVRFNPFNDLGGNQSFVIALLDKNNNGFVISSLFIKEGSRVYAKTIREGKSDYALSREEEEAVERAIKA